MGENGSLADTAMCYQEVALGGEDEKIAGYDDHDKDEDEHDLDHDDDDGGPDDGDDLMMHPSTSTCMGGGRVYDRTTVLIEQDPIRLDEEGEEDGHCGADCEEDGMAFLAEGEEGEGNEDDDDDEDEGMDGSLVFMSDPEGMAHGYVHHTISPDQIQFIINPGSTPMPRNIEGATLTLHSECPETKLREVRR